MAHLKGRSKYSSTAHSQNHPNLFCGIRVILIISRYDVTGCDSDNGKKHYPGKGVAPAEPLCRIWREISTAPFQGLRHNYPQPRPKGLGFYTAPLQGLNMKTNYKLLIFDRRSSK